jgi:hypothetical protein
VANGIVGRAFEKPARAFGIVARANGKATFSFEKVTFSNAISKGLNGTIDKKQVQNKY